ncbi:MAG: PIN domain-containing protein [Kiritimatiellia bacterium]
MKAVFDTNILIDYLNGFAHRTIELRRKFHLKIPDAVIYATARKQGCIVVSRNTRDFKTDWPDVRVPYKL